MTAEITYSDPPVNWETRAWWEGCKRGELVLQRCTACGTVQHLPRALCVSCLEPTIEHFVASGRAKVHSYTVTYQNHMPPFRDACPYVLAYVELEEGPLVMTNIVGCEPEKVAIDMPLVVEFVEPVSQGGAPGSSPEFAVPRFRPA